MRVESRCFHLSFPAHGHFLRPVNLTPLGSRKKCQQIVAFGQKERRPTKGHKKPEKKIEPKKEADT